MRHGIFFLRWWVMQKKSGGDPPAESNIVRRLFAFVFQIFNLR